MKFSLEMQFNLVCITVNAIELYYEVNNVVMNMLKKKLTTNKTVIQNSFFLVPESGD